MTGLLADLLLLNGNVLTVDSRFSRATAIAVRQETILAVGDESLVALCRPDAKQIDLKGKTVIPGQIDGYSHFITSGLDLIGTAGKVNILKLKSIDDILRAIAERTRTTPPGKWIATSCMYRGELQDKRWPNRWDLDTVSPYHPVYIMQGGRPIIANSAALQRAGIDRDTPNPKSPAGIIVRDKSGEPTGQLVAGAADMARQVWASQQNVAPEEWDFQEAQETELIEALLAQQRLFHSCGITATRDIATVRREVGAFVAARRAGLLKLRTQLILCVPERYLLSENDFEKVFEAYYLPWELGDEWLSIGGINIDYSLDGWKLIDKDLLNRIVFAGVKNGSTLAVCPGIGGELEVDEMLASLEGTAQVFPLTGRRCSMTHPMGLRRVDQISRAIGLGLTLNPNPLLIYHAAARSMRMFAEVMKTGLIQSGATDGFSQAVAMWGLSTRDWLDAGFTVSAGSNTPAATYDPEAAFCGQHSICTGETLAGILKPGQQISREEMLRIFTISGAFALRLEHRIGSIEPDKAADFVVLDRNILTCSDRDLADTKVLMTFVAGRLVYER